MAARRPRDDADAVAAASDENANPCKKARVDDDALRKTMATIGPPPAAPDPAAVPTTDVVRHLELLVPKPLATSWRDHGSGESQDERLLCRTYQRDSKEHRHDNGNNVENVEVESGSRGRQRRWW